MRSLGRLRLPLAVLAIVLSVSVVSSAGSLTFVADRTTSLNVAEDPNGVLGLEQAGSVTAGAEERLVTLENRFGSVADVTVRLTPGTPADAYLGYDGQRGDSVTVSGLATGSTADVFVCTPPKVKQVSFTFTASSTDATTRSTSPRTVQTSGTKQGQKCTSSSRSGGTDTTPPNASVEGLSARQKTSNGRYSLDVSWAASDNVGLQGGTDVIRLYDSSGTRVDTQNINPKGTSDSGTVTFKNLGGVPSGWTVELEVSDSAGNSETTEQTVP